MRGLLNSHGYIANSYWCVVLNTTNISPKYVLLLSNVKEKFLHDFYFHFQLKTPQIF